MNEQINAALAQTLGLFNRALESTPAGLEAVGTYLQVFAIAELVFSFVAMVGLGAISYVLFRGACGRYDEGRDIKEPESAEQWKKEYWHTKMKIEKAAEQSHSTRLILGFLFALSLLCSVGVAINFIQPATWASAISREAALARLAVDAIKARR